MNQIQSRLLNQADMNQNLRQTNWKARNGIAAARAAIIREFLSLHREQPRLLLLALDEAEGLAWQTGFAHLLFPVLALEKVRAVAAWHERQETLRRTQPVRSFAA